MDDIRRDGMARVLRAVRARTQRAPVHVSFDIDAVDPEVPRAGHRDAGRRRPARARPCAPRLEAAGRTMDVVCLDLVEVNPALDAPDARTARLAARLATAMLGLTG